MTPARTAFVWLLSGAGTISLLVAACGTSSPIESTGLEEPSCTTDAQCPAGRYCGGGTCVQDCVPFDTTCGAGRQCAPNGRCVDVGSGGSSGTGGGTGSGATGGTGFIPIPEGGMPDVVEEVDACAETRVELSSETPNVLLVVDRSGSMARELEAATSRWVALRSALIDPTTGLVPTVQASVNLGLALYTGPDQGYVGDPDTATEPDPDYIETEVCPYLVQVPIAANNGAAIQAAYLPASIRMGSMGQTPTGESLEGALPALTTLDPALYPGRKVIVLATDGEPDLCEDGDDEQGGRARSVEAVEAAFAAGVTTFVISVGTEVGEEHLRELANIGQGFPANDDMDRFYRAADAASLAQAFEDIVNGVRNCVFALDGMVTGDGTDGTVTVDGTPLVKDDPNGWRLNGPSEVELLGTSCELVKTGDHAIDVSFPCGVIVPIPK